MMLRAARRIFPPEEQRHIYKSIDIIGDIAIIKVARRHEVYAQQLAEALLEELKGRVKVVYRQTAPTKGYERVKILEWLAGERRSITIYREHGCSFKVDVEKVFFSPRLQYERLRIARLVKKEAPLKGGEVVVNMFSGVGTFSIIIAKHAPKVVVYSIDASPHAYNLMVENIKLNGVEGRVIPILGDAAKVVKEKLMKAADRVLMPLPELALKYLDYAVEAIRGRGWIHYYDHCEGRRREDSIELAKKKVSEKLSNLGVDFRIVEGRVVRSVGRCLYQVVLDVEVLKTCK